MNREEYVKYLIKEHGMTLKEFSQKIDIPYSTLLSMLNRSVGGASVDNVIKVCEGLGITIEDLQNAENERKPVTYKGNELSTSDILVLDLFHRVPEEQRKELLNLIEAALKMQGLL